MNFEKITSDGSVVAIFGLATLLLILAMLAGVLGVGEMRAESQYTGHVVDVVEDRGIVFRPTWVNMKTNPRSSDIQQYCVPSHAEGRLLDDFYAAMESGGRVTVSYSRPLWVSPLECQSSHSIVQSVRPANVSRVGASP